MAEAKPKKVEIGRALLDSYQKKKQQSAHGRSGDFYCATVEETKTTHSLMTVEKSLHDTDKEKMDAITLQKKTAYFDSLNSTIRHLQDTLSEKNETINSLEIQNKVLREGTGDYTPVSGGENLSKMNQELQTMVNARDVYISQLSDSLQERSEELSISLGKEKELTNEIQALQQDIITIKKQSEAKLAESYNETVEYKAKVELLTIKVQEYSDQEYSLRSYLENNHKKLELQQEELVTKNRKLEKYKNDASEDIKNLMRQVEALNHKVSKKEKELINSRMEVESLRVHFGEEITSLKSDLEKKYSEDVKKVEVLYDGMLLEHIRKSDAELKTIEKCNEAEISSCRLSCEEQITTYKEDLKQLLEKNKSAEEQLFRELDKHKQEADFYRQQVENLENKLSEEVQKIKHDCNLELDKYETEMDTFKATYGQEKIQYYESEISKLSIQLREYAVSEAKREVELETYKDELKKSADELNNLVENLSQYKEAYKKQSDHLSHCEMELNQYKELNLQLQSSLHKFQKNENQLLQELNIKNANLAEYEQKVCEFNKKIRLESNQFSEKYKVVVQSFEEQIQSLMSELEHNKAMYEQDILRLTFQTNEQQNQIKNLEAKLSEVLSVNRANEEMEDSMCDQSEDQNMIKQNLALVGKIREGNRGFLLSMLGGLRDIKGYIESLVQPDTGNNSENVQSEENIENLSQEELTKAVEKTMCNLLNTTQLLHSNVDGNVMINMTSHEDNLKCVPSNFVTSTPNVMQYYKHDLSATTLSSSYTDIMNSWVRKCASLEKENEKLMSKLKFQTENLKELECCLNVATQESDVFNRKCQILDAGISELEKTKLSEYLLRKENNELKDRLRHMEKTEEGFHKELKILNENNIKLEQLFNKNIMDLHRQLLENGQNIELENILANLKDKSEELINVKSQLVSLQKLGKDQNLRMHNIQSEYGRVIDQHEFLMTELNTKKKELEEIWEERNKLSTENKFLQAKLLSIKENSVNAFKQPTPMNNTGFVDRINNNGENNVVHSKTLIEACDFDNLSLNRMQAMHFLTSSHSLTQNFGTIPGTSSDVDQIGSQLQLLDQEVSNSLDYHMPTIPEEEEEQVEDKESLHRRVHGQHQVLS